MFEKEKPQDFGKSYEALTKKVGYEYFGNDEDSDELLEQEKQIEEERRGKKMEEYKMKIKAGQGVKRVKTGEGTEVEHLVEEEDEDFKKN